MKSRLRITPFLWFDHQGEEAANFYVSIFPNSRITDVRHYGEGGPGPAGSVMTVSFELDGQQLVALNGGPLFKFTEAVSFYVLCETQEEVDRYWDRLRDPKEPGQCGWLKDKYGLSWQIVPTALDEVLTQKDRKKAAKAMQAMLGMRKLDIAALRQAGEEA
jgi:predicted 3-demethylubiquinone-9 3-methyltransferase (glyoxalase superfamily)